MLELLGLVRILQDERIEVSLASDLELGLGGLLALLDTGRGSILAAADLNKLLDIGDFARHFEGLEAGEEWDEMVCRVQVTPTTRS